jgi:5-methylcytosine-specific restriction endonuclease McrA
MTPTSSVDRPHHAISDRALLERLIEAVRTQRRQVGEILTLLGEVEARGLHLKEGCSSLFIYCTTVLRFSEHEAYHRIEAARAVRRFPGILPLLDAGELTLTGISRLRSHLTMANHREVLERARGKTVREIDEIVVSLAPKPEARPLVRRISSAVSGAADEVGPTTILDNKEDRPLLSRASPDTPPDDRPEVARNDRESGDELTGPAPARVSLPRPVVAPLSPDRYLLRITITAETHTKLRYAQNLARHSVPSGDLATILDRALTLFVRDLERVKFARAGRPRPRRCSRDARTELRSGVSGRRIPAETRREVWHRDGGRCTFSGPAGRCQATGFLEFHHILPFAAGGPPTAENITLRCRAHNQYEADQDFGPGDQ